MSLELINQLILKGPSIATEVVNAATKAANALSTQTKDSEPQTVNVEKEDSFTDSNGNEGTKQVDSNPPTINSILKSVTGYEGPSSIAAGVKTTTNWLAQGMAWGAKAITSPVTALVELASHPSITETFSNFQKTISNIGSYIFTPVYNFFSQTCRSLFGSSSSCKAKREEAYQAKLYEQKLYQAKLDERRIADQKYYERRRLEMEANENDANEKQAEERRLAIAAEARKQESSTPAQTIARSYGLDVPSSATKIEVLRKLINEIPTDKLIAELEKLGIDIRTVLYQLEKIGEPALFKEALCLAMEGNGIEKAKALVEKKAIEMFQAA